MLNIFFTNKIPSSAEGWTDELILVASIFNEFDGLPYNRIELLERFQTISNRFPDKRDAADFRDQYGAYASYLGLTYFEKVGNSFVFRMNPRAKELLCGNLPDPQAFIRMQMALFQYPNPIGARYYIKGNLGVEALSLEKRVEQINQGIKVVPFRLFLRVLIALYANFGSSEAFLTDKEIWNCLFRNQNAVNTPDPNGVALADHVISYRRLNNIERATRSIPMQANVLRNLHILKHTGLISRPDGHRIMLQFDAGDPLSPLGKIAQAIVKMNTFFAVPQMPVGQADVQSWTHSILESGEWNKYYFGNAVALETAAAILEPIIEIDADLLNNPAFGPGATLQDFEIQRQSRAHRLQSRAANPEETIALRERANIRHKTILHLLANRMRARGWEPKSNTFIDLCCTKPVQFLFEVKSCHPDNILEQVRKGISQLYEYRYRHEELKDAKLVLALEVEPTRDLAWLNDYLIQDRNIALCWLEGEDNLACPAVCAQDLQPLMDRIA